MLLYQFSEQNHLINIVITESVYKFNVIMIHSLLN